LPTSRTKPQPWYDATRDLVRAASQHGLGLRRACGRRRRRRWIIVSAIARVFRVSQCNVRPASVHCPPNHTDTGASNSDRSAHHAQIGRGRGKGPPPPPPPPTVMLLLHPARSSSHYRRLSAPPLRRRIVVTNSMSSWSAHEYRAVSACMASRSRVEGSNGLVLRKNQRVDCERGAHPHPLLHAPGKRCWRGSCLTEPDQLEIWVAVACSWRAAHALHLDPNMPFCDGGEPTSAARRL